jgi:hypothetical protein
LTDRLAVPVDFGRIGWRYTASTTKVLVVINHQVEFFYVKIHLDCSYVAACFGWLSFLSFLFAHFGLVVQFEHAWEEVNMVGEESLFGQLEEHTVEFHVIGIGIFFVDF